VALIDINWNPKRNDLRVFAGLQLVFFSFVAYVVATRFTATGLAGGLFATSVVIAVLGIVRPLALKPLCVAWMAAAFPIGWVVSHTLMAVVYYLLMTPVGLVMRLLGRDPMERKLDRNASTYWKRREPTKGSQRYFRQF
jgi:hypothetical protein